MTIRLLSIMALATLLGCSVHQRTGKPDAPKPSELSRLHAIELEIGMQRQQVEDRVASLLSRPKQYSLYGNNLRGGVVQYRDGDWVLEVKYNAGAPAPWIETTDGAMQHLPPIDETIMEYKLEKNPNKQPEAPRYRSAPRR